MEDGMRSYAQRAHSRSYPFSLAAAVFAAALAHTAAFADMSYTPPPPIGLSLMEPGIVFCYEGGACVAPWTSLALPILATNETIEISTKSTDFNFYLGNDLSGVFAVSLSPAYMDYFSQSQDELRANVATSGALLGATSNGAFTFSATAGTEYYLLLSGLVRGDETYSLSVSAIPEPERFLLLLAGLGILALRMAKKEPPH